MAEMALTVDPGGRQEIAKVQWKYIEVFDEKVWLSKDTIEPGSYLLMLRKDMGCTVKSMSWSQLPNYPSKTDTIVVVRIGRMNE